MLIVLVFTVALIGGLGWVGNWIDRGKDPKAILRQTFAKGEIDEAEYLRRLSILEIDVAGELDDPD